MRQSTPALSALLLSNNADAIQISRVLESSGFTVARAMDAIVAHKLCKAQRFDLAVYDQDVSGAMELASLRSPSSRPRVTVGLLPSTAKHIAETRLNFIVYRPLNDDLFARIVRAAYRPIAADRRANLRHKVSIHTTSCNLLHQGEIRRLKAATIVNLSRTGMCVETSEILPQTARIQLSFLLPENGVPVRVTGTVIWTHASGQGGIQFGQLEFEEQRKLEDWLDSKFPNSELLG
jgi:CheY-like chemotaxis protein